MTNQGSWTIRIHLDQRSPLRYDCNDGKRLRSRFKTIVEHMTAARQLRSSIFESQTGSKQFTPEYPPKVWVAFVNDIYDSSVIKIVRDFCLLWQLIGLFSCCLRERTCASIARPLFARLFHSVVD